MFQSVLDENVKECSFFVQVTKNFEREYILAQECKADPALPMRDVAVVCEFEDLDDLESKLRAQLSTWLATAP